MFFIPESSATVPIDWSKVPEKSKKYFLGYWAKLNEIIEEDSDGEDDDGEDGVDDEDGANEDNASKEPSFPPTIGALAEGFEGGKFFNYFGSDLCQFLLDINEFSLKHEKLQPVGPRFYMSTGSEIWFLLFSPEGGVCGSTTTPVSDEDWDDHWDEAKEKEREVAKDFDKKLVDEVSRIGVVGVTASKTLAGWNALTMKRSLEVAHFSYSTMSSKMSLPEDHPVNVENMAILKSLFSR